MDVSDFDIKPGIVLMGDFGPVRILEVIEMHPNGHVRCKVKSLAEADQGREFEAAVFCEMNMLRIENIC